MRPPPKRNLHDFFLYQAVRFFSLRGSRERGARGFAVGLICNFFPTFGLGAVLSGFLAKLVGGNVVAGLFGGTLLAFFWPLLFLINMRVGGYFVRAPVTVNDLGDVTTQNVNALIWGQTFLIGALLNSLVVGLTAYFLFMLVYERVQPPTLRWLRRRIRRRRSILTP